eukprot:Hpha_TRINITY_DN15922_c3_g6::TRINITY_DN15922_c3_g6_i1::g.71647::m.71647
MELGHDYAVSGATSGLIQAGRSGYEQILIHEPETRGRQGYGHEKPGGLHGFGHQHLGFNPGFSSSLGQHEGAQFLQYQSRGQAGAGHIGFQHQGQLRTYAGQGVREKTAPRRGPTDGCRYRGVIKSYYGPRGYGFIQCDATRAKYGGFDVFLHKDQCGTLQVGQEVEFTIELNKDGKPQARNVVPCGMAPQHYGDQHLQQLRDRPMRLSQYQQQPQRGVGGVGGGVE